MLRRILRLGRKPALVKGTGRLGEGEARKVSFGDVLAGTGKELVFCRIGGKLYALDTRCPHEGGRISEGPLVEGRFAVCPLHRYEFDPSSGKERHDACRAARTYEVREVEGDAEVWL